MKRIIRNITSAIALLAVAASCSNNELDNMTQNKELPLELNAVVGQSVSRADASSQELNFGAISEDINFDLTVGNLGTKSMKLSSGGSINYDEGVAFEVNPAVEYQMTATVENVPVSFVKDSETFGFESNLSIDKSVRLTAVSNGTITAKGTLDFSIQTSGLYVKLNYGNAIPDGTKVKSFADDFASELQFSQDGALRKSSDNNSIIYFVKLDKAIESGAKILEVVIPGDKGYYVTVSSEIDNNQNKLFVTEANLTAPAAASRSSQGSAVVANTSAVCW